MASTRRSPGPESGPAARAATARLARLEQRLAALERRLAAEPRRSRAPATEPATRRSAAPPLGRDASPTDDSQAPLLAMVASLQERTGPTYTREDVTGAVGYAGALRVGARRYAWAHESTIPALLDADASVLARWLGAIASPPRIALLLALLGRDRTSTELSVTLGTPSAGHVYHHLKELQAAGLLLQVRRGVYRIAPPALVPLLVVLGAAADAAVALADAPTSTSPPRP